MDVFQKPIVLGVPHIFYQTLEDIFEANIRRLAYDIAKDLHEDPKILMKELKKEKVKLYLYEDSTDVNLRCTSYVVQKLEDTHIYLLCEESIVHGKKSCIKHLSAPILPPEGADIWKTLLCEDNVKYYIDILNNLYDYETGKLLSTYKTNVITKTVYQFIID